ncbi:MAG: CvpA family protein [Alphaproteobacteria bacterium]|nr:CvpA family protein [Alphaproteobacteria bacterium]
MGKLSNIDVIISLIFLLSMILAFIRGFVKEILSIVGLGLFVFLTINIFPNVTDWLKDFIKSEIMAKFVAFLLILAVFYAFWIVGTDKLISCIRASTLGFMDRLFGIVFGFLRAVIILGFSFLLTKIMIPELLKDKDLKESRYFTLAKTCSTIIEDALPEESIEKALKSVEDMNKVDNKKKEDKDEKIKEVIKEMPNKSDQEKMDKMFELLVKPELKKITQNSNNNENSVDEKKGYNQNDTSSLDKLIEATE